MSLAAVQTAAAADIVLQLKWVAQSQFAGYYVAADKGFYEEEGLDVEIKAGGPDIAPEQVIAGGGADVIVAWMGGALVAREKGVPLVNIAQPYQKSGLQLICPKDGPIKTEADFKGHTLGVWFFGNEYPFFAWMNKLGLSTEGGPDGVTVLKQSFDVQPLVQKQADCISVMTYNEYWQAIDAGFKPEDLVVFNYTEMGNDLLEDGLYVLEDKLADPGLQGKHGEVRPRLDEGLEIRHGEPGRGGRDRHGQWRPGRQPPEAHDGRGGEADRRRNGQARSGRL
jgi:ABC-type nitrate/sulfonate/bicarbonate transport systems, periplasmic components